MIQWVTRSPIELFWTAKNKLQWQNSLNWAKTVCCCGWKGRKIEMVCKWKKWSVNQTLDNLTWRLFSRHCYLPTICEHFSTNFKINQENEKIHPALYITGKRIYQHRVHVAKSSFGIVPEKWNSSEKRRFAPGCVWQCGVSKGSSSISKPFPRAPLLQLILNCVTLDMEGIFSIGQQMERI